MILTHTAIEIPLPTPNRIISLFQVSSTALLLSTKTDILTYNLPNLELTSQIPITSISKEKPKIIDLCYHAYMKTVFILLSRAPNVKHQNWILLSLKHPFNMSTLEILDDYEKSMSRYKEMELKPRMIAMHNSQYFVLLREFYNDSLVVVWKNGIKVKEFFVNQENMSDFDGNSGLVSFRAVFKNRAAFSVFDIEQSSAKEVAHELNTTSSGVIFSIQSMQGPEKVKSAHKFTAIICINNKNKSLTYFIYDSETKDILQSLHDLNTKPESIFLWGSILLNNRMCSLQMSGTKYQLVYEKVLMGKGETCDLQTYEADEMLEEWEFGWIKNGVGIASISEGFYFANYSQNVKNENSVICRLYRSVERKELRLAMAQKLEINEGLLSDIFSMYENEH